MTGALIGAAIGYLGAGAAVVLAHAVCRRRSR